MLHERSSSADDGPFLVTNNRGSFVPTRLRPDRTVWAGFTEAPLGQEDPLLQAFFRVLWRLSLEQGWSNRCTRLVDAMPQMKARGLEPSALVVPVPLLREACGQPFTSEDADKLMLARGHVAKMGAVRVLAADLRPGTALLFASPAKTGTYTRSDQALAAIFFRVDRAVVLVDTEARNGVA